VTAGVHPNDTPPDPPPDPVVRPAGVVAPELYLRLVGERILRKARAGGSAAGELGTAASALAAVGGVPADVAVTVLDDYTLAAGLRGDGDALHRLHRSPPHRSGTPAAAPVAPKVAGCRAVPPPAGTSPVGGSGDGWAWEVHYAVLADDETTLAVSASTPPPWEGNPSRRGRGRPAPHWRMGGSGGMDMGDDTGRVEPAHFSGGGGGGSWAGHYSTRAALSAGTRWLELDGHRVELIPTSPPPVTVQDHSEGTPVESYLRHALAAADPNRDRRGGSDPAVDALLATGALDPGSAVLAEYRAVHADAPNRPARYWQSPPGTVMVSQFGPFPTSVPQPGGGAAAEDLPECWRSVRRTVTAPAPVGSLPLGVATPLVEGTAAVLLALSSTPDGFTVDTIETGGQAADPDGEQVTSPVFAWWARDDLGQWYLGDWSSWSSTGTERTGEVLYRPPLDPRARTLRLLPTMPSRRAVIDVALPDWTAAS